MKTAIIAPIAELGSFDHTDKLHLVLSHLLSDDEYHRFYADKRTKGDYLILDNSAHEHRVPATPKQLMQDATLIQAQEIVLPDVPYDGELTLKLVGNALDYWPRYMHLGMMELKPRMMFVPQGATLDEWRTCLFGLVLKVGRFYREYPEMIPPHKYTPVIGLPAKYEKQFGPGTIRKLLETWLKPNHEEGFAIHLLGCRELWGLNDLAQEFPWIRSIDSAKPVVYGRYGILLDPMHTKEPEKIGRPENYFELRLSDHQRTVAQHNETVFRNLAQGKYKGHK